MRPNPTKLIVSIVVAVLVLGIGIYVLVGGREASTPAPAVETPVVTSPVHSVIGKSVEGRDIDVYTYGTGDTHLLFVGGIHGGYEWNSVLLAYTYMDYLAEHPDLVPKDMTISVIPSANPDGVYRVTGKNGRFAVADVATDKTIQASGRFNANKVDLNRNFACKWQAKSTWQSKTVSAGTKAFSEPEAAALRDYVAEFKPAGAIFWHSQSNAIYASQCKDGILPVTLDIMNTYSTATGYPAVKTFDAYATTGAADDWLASIHIPAITVELQTHDTVELERNLKGIKAVIAYFAPKPQVSATTGSSGYTGYSVSPTEDASDPRYCHHFSTFIKEGDTGVVGSDVYSLNQILAIREQLLPIAKNTADYNTFTKSTTAALKTYQAKHSISETGIVDSPTLIKLNEKYSCGK
jgi:predicted deacylase